MDQPLISVIIPVYNMELYLERCLDSVLNNTYRNLEVICIDDGSTDRSLDILHRFETEDSRIVVIAKENGGVSSARNAGLDRMAGEYFTFVDPDDYVHPQYIELLYRTLKESRTSISICAFQQVEDGTPLKPEKISFDPDTIQVYSFSQIVKEHSLRAYSGGRLICNTLAAGVRFRDKMQYGEDTLFFSEICERERTGKVSFTPYMLYYYFQRNDSLTKTASAELQLQYIETIFEKLFQTENQDVLYLDHAIRVCLPLRYMTTYILGNRAVARKCNTLLHSSLGRIAKTKIFSVKEKVGICTCILVPRTYWLYRVIKDPSMLKWEKMERKARKNRSKNIVNKGVFL